MALRNIVKEGDEVLTKKCRPVEKFDDRLAPSVEKIHGNVKHIGKNVTYTEATNTEKKTANDTLAQLKEELKQAVKEQRFEDAATLRDKIKELNKED